MEPIRQRPNECFKWVIVLCSFINQAVTAGSLMSLGVMYVSWLEEFQEPKGDTGWVLSLAFSLHNGISPLPANLATRYGFRLVAFIGGILSFVGLVAGTFASSVTQLIITIGFVTGVGSCFAYLPSVAIVQLYFDKRRSLATGICSAGVGMGAFILSPFVNYLIETYAWRGALLILGAVNLNLCATGLLFRPVDIESLDDERRKEEAVSLVEGGAESKMKCDAVIPSVTAEVVEADFKEQNVQGDKYFSTVSTPVAQMILLKSRLRIFDVDRMHGSLNDLGPRKTTSTHSSFPNLNQEQKGKLSHENLIRSLRNLDVALLGSVSISLALKDDHENRELSKSLPTNDQAQQKDGIEGPKGNNCRAIQLLSSIGEKTQLNVLRDKLFLVFCVSNFLTCLAFFTPVVYLVDRAVHQGIDIAVGAILISSSGCGNILGRIVTGLVSDCCSNRLMVYLVALCTQGTGTILSCFCGDIAILHVIFATFFGFHMGIYAVLSPLVTIDLKGRSNVAQAYGVVLMFGGVAFLFGGPIAGGLFDWSRSYELPYIVNGLFLVVSGLLVIPLICRRRAHLEKV